VVNKVVYYLQEHFDGEDTGEHIIEVVEDEISERMFKDRIFSGQCHAAGTDDDHDKQVEVSKIDDKVTKPTNTTQPNAVLSVSGAVLGKKYLGGAGPSSFGRQQRAELLCPVVQY